MPNGVVGIVRLGVGILSGGPPFFGNWPAVPLDINIDGDSISTTAFQTTPPGPYWEIAQNSNILQPSSGYSYAQNIAVGGEKVSTMAANIATAGASVVSAAHAAGHKAVASVFGGTNDFCNPSYPSATVAQVEASWQLYASNARSAGFDYVVLGGILPRGEDGVPSALPAQFNIDRQQANSDAVANYKSWGFDAVCPIGLDPSWNNIPAIFGNILTGGDQTHPLPPGATIFALYWAYAIMSIGSNALLTGVSVASGTSAGGTNLTVTGRGFSRQFTPVVGIGGIQATNVTVLSDTQLTCTTGAAYGTGTGPCFVLTGLGSAALYNAWTYT